MNSRDLKKFEKLLMAEVLQLQDGIRNIEEQNLYDTFMEHTNDLTSYAEAGTDNFERETALNIASSESERLQDVVDALERLKEGTYGTCEGCECKIPRKRLEVFPSARYCIECQSKLERDGVLD